MIKGQSEILAQVNATAQRVEAWRSDPNYTRSGLRRAEELALEVCLDLIARYPRIATRLADPLASAPASSSSSGIGLLPAVFTPVVDAASAGTSARSDAPGFGQVQNQDQEARAEEFATVPPLRLPPGVPEYPEDSFVSRAMRDNHSLRDVYDELNADSAEANAKRIVERLDKYEKRFKQYGAWCFTVPDDGSYLVLLYNDFPNALMYSSIKQRWSGARDLVYRSGDRAADIAGDVDFKRVYKCYSRFITGYLEFVRYADLDAVARPLADVEQAVDQGAGETAPSSADQSSADVTATTTDPAAAAAESGEGAAE